MDRRILLAAVPVALLVAPLVLLGAPSGGSPLADRFSEDRAWAHLEALVAMGPRAHGHPGHRRAVAYLRSQMQAAGAVVEEMPFRHQGLHDEAPESFRNVSARFGERGPGWVLLGTHFDSRRWGEEDDDPEKREVPIVGANDSGSSTAVLLEIGRVLGEHPPPVGVEIVFFDGEEYGRPGELEDYFLGSRHLARNWARLRPGPRPEAVVVIDMVGDRDLVFRRELASIRSFPELTRSLWQAAERLGYEEQFPKRRGALAVLDDHSPFLANGFAAALLIDFDYPWWHTSHDTLDKCDRRSLGITGRVLLEALFDAPARSAD